MAHSALVSLKRTLQRHVHGRTMFCAEEEEFVERLLENLEFFRQFLESFPSSQSLVTRFAPKIRDAAYRAQDLVDLREIDDHGVQLKNGGLESIVECTESIVEEITTFKSTLTSDIITYENELQIDRFDQQPSHSLRAKLGSNDENLMEEFDYQLMQIKDGLTGEPCALKVVAIAGMGGIGKTTLAVNTYNDRYVQQYFDIRAWVTVSQSYCTKNILLDLLHCMQKLTLEMHRDCEYVLMDILHKTLKEKRYLIVMDDVWDTDAWDALRRALPDDSNGSRIIITTRITDVAVYASSLGSPYQMSLLSDDGGWNLLRAKVFGSESWPLDLEGIGKDIARKCAGLPLSIVVIGGLLSKVNKTYEAWRAVTENMTSLVSSVGDLCYGILKMSYDYLPQHLKSCFLHMGVFPENREIYASKLTRLWIAEGFLDPICSNGLEEMAESFLEELVDRSLISVSKKRPNGKIESCRIHDLLLDVCVKEAESEKILQVSKLYSNPFSEASMHQRRLSIHLMDVNIFLRTIRASDSSSLVRSLVIMGKYFFGSRVFSRFKLLRVLDVINGVFHQFPDEVSELWHLRYIAFTWNGHIPASLTKLYNLQTLIVCQSVYRNNVDAKHIPFEIWKMASLRHIILIGDYVIIVDPDHCDLSGSDNFMLDVLQTLSGVRNLKLTKELLQRIWNIRKLDLIYDTSGCKWNEFENLASLFHLKELEIFIDIRRNDYRDRIPRLKLDFPQSLETLTLSGCGIPWKDMSIVGSLPHLQVLNLRTDSCIGEEWETNEGEFCQLKHLELEGLDDLMNWNSEHSHFPALERITVRYCYRLVEIPSGMGESPALTVIDLCGCKESAFESAYNIQETQKDLGNDDFQVFISDKFVIPLMRKLTLKSFKWKAEMKKFI